MKRQAILSYTILQIQITALLGSWVINTSSIKGSCPQKKFVVIFS